MSHELIKMKRKDKNAASAATRAGKRKPVRAEAEAMKSEAPGKVTRGGRIKKRMPDFIRGDILREIRHPFCFCFNRSPGELAAYACLLTMRVSVSPLARSIMRTNRETLLSGFRLSHNSAVSASSESGISTRLGSPSKLGSGSPSCM